MMAVKTGLALGFQSASRCLSHAKIKIRTLLDVVLTHPTDKRFVLLIRGICSMNVRLLFAVVGLLVVWENSAWAVNLSFMPGDAFFSIRLTAKVVDALPAEGGTLDLSYAYPKGSGDFCGYAGFEKLQILDASPEFVDRIKSVYRAARVDVPVRIQISVDEDGSRKEFELNGFQAFVCNRDVDWKKQRIGIKYNEDWFNLPKKALAGPRGDGTGKHTACMQYVSFVPGARAVEHDWKYAARYAPLTAVVPDIEGWGVAGEEIEEPVSVRAKEIEIIVLKYGSIKAAFNQKDGVAFFSISDEGVRYCTWGVEDYGDPDLRYSDDPWTGVE
jgi:hypothetical protein